MAFYGLLSLGSWLAGSSSRDRGEDSEKFNLSLAATHTHTSLHARILRVHIKSVAAVVSAAAQLSCNPSG